MLKQNLLKGLMVGLSLFASTMLYAAKTYKVIIIGAGMAGLSAADYLKHHNVNDFIILEGKRHIGGRTYTEQGMDLGASWIHGAGPYNPLTHLAKKINLAYKVSDETNAMLYNASGKVITASQEDTDDMLFKRFMRFLSARQSNTELTSVVADPVIAFINKYKLNKAQQSALLYRISVTIEQEYAADITKLSLAHYNSDDSFRGPEWLVTGGFSQMVNYLARNLKSHIKLGQRVSKIDYRNPNQVIVTTSTGKQYIAKTVISTLPAGVLKKGVVRFVPQLPLAKRAALSHINMGVLNKIWLRFPRKFWGNTEFIEREANAYLTKKGFVGKGNYIEFVNIHHYTGKPMLLALISGDFAKQIERKSNQQVIGEIMGILRGIYGKRIPNPIASKITRWGQDKYTFGAYSSLGKGAVADNGDYIAMATPIGQQIYFAGEATEKDFPGTVHGAYLSGLREARRVLGQNTGLVRAVSNAVTGFSYILSNDLTTWGRGSWGIDLMPTFQKYTGSKITSFPIEVGYGVSDSIDFRLGFNSYQQITETGEPIYKGVGDLHVALKKVFFNVQNAHRDVAINLYASFPTGNFNQYISDGFIHILPSVLVAQYIFLPNWDVQFMAEAGVDMSSRQKKHSDPVDNNPSLTTLVFNAGVGIKNDHNLFTTELNIENSRIGGQSQGYNEIYITPAMHHFIGSAFSIGVGLPIGLTHDAANYQVVVAASLQLDA